MLDHRRRENIYFPFDKYSMMIMGDECFRKLGWPTGEKIEDRIDGEEGWIYPSTIRFRLNFWRYSIDTRFIDIEENSSRENIR